MILNLWLSLGARIDAIVCKMMGHRVSWHSDADELCPGDIVCETCNVIHWCRSHDQWEKEMQRDRGEGATTDSGNMDYPPA